MEKKTIKISKFRYDKKINEMLSFLWVIESKKEVNDGYIVTFVRDINDEDRLLLTKQENKIKMLGVLPFIIQAILCIIAIGLLTVFVVTMKQIDILIGFLSFVLPAAIFLTTAVIIHVYYTKTIFKKMEIEANKTHQLVNQIKEKNNYGNSHN